MNDEKLKSEFDAHPLAQLPREDLNLIMELVLQSGSLKDLATAYGVTYPTIRARVDRLIERLKAAQNGERPDAITRLLSGMVARGDITPAAARQLLDAARQSRQEHNVI